MKSNLNKIRFHNFQHLLWASLGADTFFLVILIVTPTRSLSLFSNSLRLGTFIIILIATLLTIWFRRKNYQELAAITRIVSLLQEISPFLAALAFFGLSANAGIIFLLLPAYDAFQVLVDIPRLYPQITPAVGWITSQVIILYSTVLVFRIGGQDEIIAERKNLRQLLLISIGLLMGSLYASSIFIAWYAQRGFVLF